MPIAAPFVRGLEGTMRLRKNNKPLPPELKGFRNPVPPPPPGGGGILSKIIKIGARLSPILLPFIVIADILLNAKTVSDGTLPDWITKVGEQQTIDNGIPAPFTGGQDYNATYIVTLNITSIHNIYRIKRTLDIGFANVQGKISKIYVAPTYTESQVTSQTPPQPYYAESINSQGIKTIYRQQDWGGSNEVIIKINKITVVRRDGQPDTGGNLPPVVEPTKSASTWDAGRALIDTLTADDWKFSGFTDLPDFPLPAGGIGFEPIPYPMPEPDLTTIPGAVPTEKPKPFPDPEPKPEYDIDGDRDPVPQPNKLPDPVPKPKPKWTKKTTYLDENGNYPAIAPDPQPNNNPKPQPEPDQQPKWTKITNYLPEPIKEKQTYYSPIPFPPVNKTPTVKDDDPKPSAPPIIPPPIPPVQTPVDKCAGSCASKPANLNPQDSTNLARLNTLLQSIDLGLLKKIDATTTITKEAVKSTVYGLEKIQSFATTAWSNTRFSKVLEILSLALTLHNAAMLSRNLAGSLGDVISAIANNTISLIKNEESQSIDLNETLGNSIEGFLKSILGNDSYQNLSETFSKYNRIVNSASNVIYSITSIQAGLTEGLETIGNYTGRIGNALKKSGAVLESSYSWMSEKVSVKTGRLAQIQKILDTGEGIENFASEIENATSEFREVQENVTNIGSEFNKIKTEFATQETEKTTKESTVKTNSQAAQPNLGDFVRDPIE